MTRLGNINERLRDDSSVLSNESRSSQSSSRNSNHDSCDGGVGGKNPDNLNVSSTSLLDELRNEDASFTEIEERDFDENVNNTLNSSFADLTTSICLTSDEITINNTHTNIDNGDDTGPPPDKPPRKDPNRPRYTLGEMQSLLEERNTYKIKMMALEEELDLYKEG